MKILLATDGSKYSEAAADFLTFLKLRPEDEITVFHALSWIPFRYDRDFYFDALNEIKREIAPRILDRSLEILRTVKARLSTLILEGSPEQCIVDAVKESETDMIVMGARGIRGIESLFVGSVTRSVAVTSPKPVLVIKLPRDRRRPEKIRILLAADGSDHSMATGNLLSSVPFGDDAEVMVLNVVPPVFVDIPQTFVPEINERFLEVAEKERSARMVESKKLLDGMREHLGKNFTQIQVLSEVGDPAKEILKVSQRERADIIAVGCRGLRGIKGMLGSVSRNILAHSECSVLIGKACKE
ncbi:MAG TPA: universal stress protein [Thermodesulfovibrionales bacterium]|jgi:nucleotide-binding universal stress UspA family protein|nr:universal stress protein [Thermodesulfovibrionales bacterium]